MIALSPRRSRAVAAAAAFLHLLAHYVHGQELKYTTTKPVTIAAIALSIKSRAIQDSRCYLMNGGAVESFFISEATPVGAVVGTLSVNGDPREGEGNIDLSLQEKDAAVGIAPGTKNLTLLRPLDREEIVGPSNVYVNVRCDRRRTNDPSFIIPVSVRVWDVNDNAPVWSGAPYVARLSELTAPGSRVLSGTRATDADQPAHATIHYSVVPSPYSEYFSFVNELDSILVLKKALDFETLPNFTVTLRAQDQGEPAPLYADAELQVQVLDADDQNPKFVYDSYVTVLPNDAKEGDILTLTPEPLSAYDQDLGINAPLYYTAVGEHRDLLNIDRDSGIVQVNSKLLQSDVTLPITIIIRATQYDNADRYALSTIRIDAVLARYLRLTHRHYQTAVPEDTSTGTVLLTLTTTRRGDKTPLQFFVSDRSFLEHFAINSAGELVLRQPLDYETQDHYAYQVMVTDGVYNDTATLNLTVLNVNDWEPRFRHPHYEFQVEGEGAEGDGGLVRVGRVDVFDGDKGDYVALSVRGPDANMFYINDSGELFLRTEALPLLNSSSVHVTATAHDSGSPPRQTSVPVVVHVSGAERGVRGRGLVLAMFAAALAVLALLVLLLLAYIYRKPRYANRAPPPSPPGSLPPGPVGALGGAGIGTTGSLQSVSARASTIIKYIKRVKRAPPPSPPAPLAPGPVGEALGSGGVGTAGSLQSVSAGASTILANSTSSLHLPTTDLPPPTQTRQSLQFPTKTKVAPLPPTLASGAPALLSDHVGLGASRSGVAWPANTIPARVKKLSWDDTNMEPGAKINGDLEGDIHDATNPTLHDHMNLTVYF